jgi:hypothetical protein
VLRGLTKVALVCAGALGVILGAHGLYIYFKLSSFRGMLITAAAMESSNLSPEQYLSRLFLAWGVPNPFRDWVLWATVRGFESWFVPAVLFVAGVFLLGAQADWVPQFRLGSPVKGTWKHKATIRQKAIKTLLCLLLIVIVSFLVWSAYFVFLRKEHPIWGLNAVAGAMAIIVTMVLIALNIKTLESHRYRWTPPGFSAVLAVVAVVVLVFAFAGVQPLSGYKDDAISSVKGSFSGGTSSDSGEIATLQSMTTHMEYRAVTVELKPTSLAQANQSYTVELYEKGRLRGSNTVSWNQPELNVRETAWVDFKVLSVEEKNAYSSASESELRKMFSIRVHQ